MQLANNEKESSLDLCLDTASGADATYSLENREKGSDT